MSLVPAEKEPNPVIQRTELESIDKNEPAIRWAKFCRWVRKAVGRKPRELAERFAEAEVKSREIDNEIKLAKAKADYEKALAEARKIEREAEGNLELQRANAEKLKADARIKKAVARLIESKERDPAKIAKRLKVIIEQIRLAGGSVEIEVNQLFAQLGDAGAGKSDVKQISGNPADPKTASQQGQ